MKGVQCYELFGGIALKNHAFFSPYQLQKKPSHSHSIFYSTHAIPLLNKPTHSKAILGDRSFFCFSVYNYIADDAGCAPSLPSFKSRLNTYLLRSVYKETSFYFDHCKHVHGLSMLLTYCQCKKHLQNSLFVLPLPQQYCTIICH